MSESNSGDETTALAQEKAPEKVRRMFAEIAPRYDFLNRVLSLGIDVWWRRFTVRRLLRPDTRRILDICAGTGDLALAFHKEALRRGMKPPVIVATDFTLAMLNLAGTKFQRAQRRGVWAANGAQGEGSVQSAAAGRVAAVADATSSPFPDSTFDLITVAFGIRNVADREAALAEMVRVCRPGGTVAVLEFSKIRAPGLGRAFDWYFKRVLPRVGALVSRTKAYRYLAESAAAFPDTDEFVAELSIAAGSSATARRLTFGISTLYVAQVPKKPAITAPSTVPPGLAASN